MGPGGCKALGGSVLVVGGHRGFARGREVGETDGGSKKRKCQCTKVPTAVQKYTKLQNTKKTNYQKYKSTKLQHECVQKTQLKGKCERMAGGTTG